jgi:hypothetical protein
MFRLPPTPPQLQVKNTYFLFVPSARCVTHSSIIVLEKRKSLEPGRGMRGNLPSLTHFLSVSGCTPIYAAAVSADQSPSEYSGLSILNRSSGGNEPGYQRLSNAQNGTDLQLNRNVAPIQYWLSVSTNGLALGGGATRPLRICSGVLHGTLRSCPIVMMYVQSATNTTSSKMRVDTDFSALRERSPRKLRLVPGAQRRRRVSTTRNNGRDC